MSKPFRPRSGCILVFAGVVYNGRWVRSLRMGDPFLNYFALGLLVFVIVVLFYGIIAIHDIPYLIAKSREDPHQDAIHAAGWVSLFTLHALWPFLWIWAMAYRARLAYSSNIDGVNTAVARLRAEVSDAEYDLDQAGVRAPGAGFVTQVALRPGVYVTPIQMRPAMVFVNTEKRDQELGAAFRQNSLQRVKSGDEAEVAFDAVPGRVFKGKVRF